MFLSNNMSTKSPVLWKLNFLALTNTRNSVGKETLQMREALKMSNKWVHDLQAMSQCKIGGYETQLLYDTSHTPNEIKPKAACKLEHVKWNLHCKWGHGFELTYFSWHVCFLWFLPWCEFSFESYFDVDFINLSFSFFLVEYITLWSLCTKRSLLW